MKITNENQIGHIIAKSGSKSSIKQEMLNVIDKHFYQSCNWTCFIGNRGNRLIANYIKLINNQSIFLADKSWYEEEFNISEKAWDQILTKESVEKHVRNLLGSYYEDSGNPERVKEFANKVIDRYPEMTLKQLIKVYKIFLHLGGPFFESGSDEKIEEIEQLLR